MVGAILFASGCTSVNTFGLAARQGDTVAIALGWQQDLTSQNIEVTVTDFMGNPTTYPAGNPAIRAVINTYPDPVSNLIVGAESGQPNIGGTLAGVATSLIDNSVTNMDKDYLQTFLLLDLPASMSPGMATISVKDSLGNPIPNPYIFNTSINDIFVDILPNTTGVSNTFATQEAIVITNYLSSFERAPHNTITLSGSTVPYGVEMVLNYTLGTGSAYVANPRGDLKNINWSDNGSALKVILLPARAQALANIKQFKFYVAGGITNLTLGSISAYDVNGVSIPGITATIN
jgi:hypothetical protein